MKDACLRLQGELVRVEAGPGLARWGTYLCLECGARTIFRCGDVRIPHFAHSPYDPRGATCPYRSAPPDTRVGGGHFFGHHGDQSPIREAQPSLVPVGSQAFNRAARLNLWLTAERKDPQTTWAFRFGLGLPQLGVETPDLERLHGLHLAVKDVASEGSLSWRLWPGPGLDPVPVPLLEGYDLDVDPRWPTCPPWRKEALEAAHVELQPQANAFLLEEDEGGPLQGRLAMAPVTLPLGSHLLNLTLEPEKPPAAFRPVRLGTCKGGQDTWYVWDLFLPSGLGGLDNAALEWLEVQDWHLSEEKTVRVVSPPPVAFDGLVPIFPSKGKGWALLETRPALDSSSEPRAWLMNAPVPGARYQLPEGRSPGIVKCQELPVDWVDISYPQLVLVKDGEPFETLQLRGKSLQKVIAGVDARRLGWVFRSALPLSVLAGPPGRLDPLVWQPEGRLLGMEEGIRSAIQAGLPYQVLIQGPGIPRVLVAFTPPKTNAHRGQGSAYHKVLRLKSGWPQYTHSEAPEAPR